jgi:hypothetical protein
LCAAPISEIRARTSAVLRRLRQFATV